MQYPIEHGKIVATDEYFDAFLGYVFRDLPAAPSERPVLFSESPTSAFADRERLVQHLFESFQVPATYVSSAGPLAAYASGRCTSLAVGMGDVTSTFPVYEGCGVVFVATHTHTHTLLTHYSHTQTLQLYGAELDSASGLWRSRSKSRVVAATCRLERERVAVGLRSAARAGARRERASVLRQRRLCASVAARRRSARCCAEAKRRSRHDIIVMADFVAFVVVVVVNNNNATCSANAVHAARWSPARRWR